jgi:hypothetical protein
LDVRHLKKVPSKKLLDHEALVSAGDNEIIQTVSGIYFHDVPGERFIADFDHWLWPIIGFFGKPSSHTACKDNSFHWVTAINSVTSAHGVAMVYSDAALSGL